MTLKHIRTVEPQGEDQPNTPSKSKLLLPRRSYGFYAALVLAVIVAGSLVLRRNSGPRQGGRPESYYRKALVSRMYGRVEGDPSGAEGEGEGEGEEVVVAAGGGLRQQVDNSEARQREALEIADKILLLHGIAGGGGGGGGGASPGAGRQAALGSLAAGGGSVESRPVLEVEQDVPLLELEDAGQQEQEQHQHQQQKQQQQQPQEEAGGGSGEGPLGEGGPPAGLAATAVVAHTRDDGEVRTLVVDAARFADLESMSQGLESQDLEADPGRAEHLSWWTNLVDAAGTRAPAAALAPEGASAAAAAAAQQPHPHADPGDAAAAPAAVGGSGSTPDDECRIYVLDVAAELGPSIGARACTLAYKRVWPFSRHHFGIDGVDTLQPEDYQYSIEYWLAAAIRNSSRHAPDMASADVVFVDMWCYHTAWLAYVHPLSPRNTTNPEPYMRRGLKAVMNMDRFVATKGADFAVAHPSPAMAGLLGEDAMCEDLASAYNLVLERSSLCVWTQGSAAAGASAIVPYVATLDLDWEADLQSAERDLFLFFRGGCGHPEPSIRGLFAAGKMLRYALVEALRALGEADVAAECSCDVCDNRLPHEQAMEAYRRATFCPVLPSNAQSSRRLSEVVLSGCVPVFLGPPFHSLPLAQDVDYAGMAVFLSVRDTPWVDTASPNALQNHMAARLWPLDDPALEAAVVHVDSLEAAIDYLREMDPQVVAAKRAAVLRERLKFYYGAAPAAAGGDGKASALGELAMKRMCRHAAAAKRRAKPGGAEGGPTATSQAQQQQGSGWLSALAGR